MKKPDGAPLGLQGAIVVIIDTARADRLSAYGYRRKTSPGLQNLAARGILFEQVVSYAPWTLPSVASILAGDRFARGYDIPAGKLRRSLVEDVQRAGYATAAVTEGGFVSAHFGFERGFDDFREERGAVFLTEGDAGEPAQERGRGGVKKTFSLAGRWLREHVDERFFLLIHTYEPHVPYGRGFFIKNVPRGNLGRVLDSDMVDRIHNGEVEIGDTERRFAGALYDGGLRAADSEVAVLMRLLEQLGLGDRTLLVVTSDHGEDLGERSPHHLGDHGHSLFDEQLMVPLVIADPTRSYPVSRVTTQVRSIDILPTVVDLLGIPVPSDIEGRSLAPIMRGEEVGDRIAFGGLTKQAPAQYFIRHQGFKYIESSPGETSDGSPLPAAVELYDLRRDPGERTNLADQNPERVRKLHNQLLESLNGQQEALAIDAATQDIDDAMQQRLRSLGYLE